VSACKTRTQASAAKRGTDAPRRVVEAKAEGST
jgi:hypothetical protein